MRNFTQNNTENTGINNLVLSPDFRNNSPLKKAFARNVKFVEKSTTVNHCTLELHTTHTISQFIAFFEADLNINVQNLQIVNQAFQKATIEYNIKY